MKKRIIYALLIIFLVVILDQFTKYLVSAYIEPHETVKVNALINLVNVKNTGAAFGILKDLGNTFFIIISFAAVLFISWVIVTGREDYRIFSLLAGGATGNLIDRLNLGYVVDFVDAHVAGYHWPAFNIADSSLTVGIFLIVIGLLKRKR
jgi:signal peptidase II